MNKCNVFYTCSLRVFAVGPRWEYDTYSGVCLCPELSDMFATHHRTAPWCATCSIYRIIYLYIYIYNIHTAHAGDAGGYETHEMWVSLKLWHVCMCIYIYYKYTPQLATLTGKNGNKPWDFSTLEGPNPFIIGRPHEDSSAGGSPHWCRLNHRTVLETFKLPELSCSLRACGLAKWERHEWKKTVSLTRNCFAM